MKHVRFKSHFYLAGERKQIIIYGDDCMKILSLTQEYFLYTINNKLDISYSLDTTFPACLFAGGIMELLSHGYITLVEKDKLVADKT